MDDGTRTEELPTLAYPGRAALPKKTAGSSLESADAGHDGALT